MPAKRFWILWIFLSVAIVGAFLASGALLRNSLADAVSANDRIRDARTLLSRSIKVQLDEETGVRGYLDTHDRVFLEPYDAGLTLLPPTLAQLADATRSLHLADATVHVAAAQELNARWLHSVAEPLIAQRARAPLATQKLGRQLIDRYRIEITAASRAFDARYADIKAEFDTDLALIGLLVVVAGLLLGAAAVLSSIAQRRAWHRLELERTRSEEANQQARAMRAAYEAERRVAETLQEAFLQRELPAIPSMRLSATYMPATEEAKVGGDWYDALEIGSHHILFTIGDIAGHGLEAAVAMSRIRNAVLASALLRSDPASILTRVNQGILATAQAPMATAVVGIADSQTYEFVYSTAGHPPPILVEPGRAPRVLEFSGLPLGVYGTPKYVEYRVQSVPGATLILYTDGAVEHSRDVLAGERLLLEAIVDAAKNPEGDVATAIYRSIFANIPVADDVAILTIGFATSRRTGFPTRVPAS
jgi:CHASE3 domain sensor protein